MVYEENAISECCVKYGAVLESETQNYLIIPCNVLFGNAHSLFYLFLRIIAISLLALIVKKKNYKLEFKLFLPISLSLMGQKEN